MITIRLPASLRTSADDLLLVPDDVRSIADLIDALDRRVPGFRDQFEQGGFNFAVNDELVLYRVRDRALHSGDTVEIVPTISGGSPCGPAARSRARARKAGHYRNGRPRPSL